MNLGLVVHYKNKFPKCQVKFDDSGLDVYSQDGKHLVCLKKNGAGQLVDMSEQMFCYEKHDLSPLKKDGRCYKLTKENKIEMDDLYRDRRDMVKEEIENYSTHGSDLVEKRPWGGFMVKCEDKK